MLERLPSLSRTSGQVMGSANKGLNEPRGDRLLRRMTEALHDAPVAVDGAVHAGGGEGARGVEDDVVKILLLVLHQRLVDRVLDFEREADEDPPFLALAEGPEDVARPDELERQRRGVLLQLP